MTSFRNLHQPTGRTIHFDGQDYAFFGGTAYLGLLDNPAYIQFYKQGIDAYGLNNGTSRTNNVQLGIYEEAEKHMAQRFGFEDAVLLSSGYLAAQAAVRSLAKVGQVFYAPGSHPALWLEENPSENRSFQQWKTDVIQEIQESAGSQFVIISNCLDNLTPELFDFSDFQQLPKHKKVLFILDDSHGIAVLEKNRPSVDIAAFESENLEFVLLASLAKGMGTDAGVILGPERYIHLIRKHPIYMGASPSAPAALFALLKGQKIYEAAFDRLHENIAIAEDLLAQAKLQQVPRFPVFTSKEPGLYRALLKKKVLISSFPYPLPTSPLLNRIVISALHTREDIQILSEILLSQDVLIL